MFCKGFSVCILIIEGAFLHFALIYIPKICFQILCFQIILDMAMNESSIDLISCYPNDLLMAILSQVGSTCANDLFRVKIRYI